MKNPPALASTEKNYLKKILPPRPDNHNEMVAPLLTLGLG